MFGPIVSGRDVRLAMVAHLKKWFPTYLAEVCRNANRDPEKVPGFRSWVSALDIEDRYEEHQLPSCLVVAPGLLTDPEKMSGKWQAVWSVSVAAVVASQDRENTFELTELYAAAIRAAVLHKPSLGGFATATDWIGERYDEIPNDTLRTLAAGAVQFGVAVDNALEVNAGPDEPGQDPAERPTFLTVDNTVEGGYTP